jgi:hypothetical protein
MPQWPVNRGEAEKKLAPILSDLALSSDIVGNGASSTLGEVGMGGSD